MNRNLSPAIDIIRRYEGIADGDRSTVNLDPYMCPAGIWTIGWGHVVRDSIGMPIKGAERKQQAKAIYPNGITMIEAERILMTDVRDFAMGVEEMVKVSISDGKFCALVSFAYNVGLGALEKSTLLLMLNRGKLDAVPGQLMRWTKSGGKELLGLRRRREAESALWSAS